MADFQHKMLKAILDGCKQDKREMQKQLFDLYYSYALSVCLRYTSQIEDAKEILSDGYVKVFNSLHRFIYPEDITKINSAFTAWLKKIMVFTAIDHYRTHQKEGKHEELSERNIYESYYEDNSLNRLAYEDLLKIVQQLSPVYRTVFNLYVIDGFSHEEIAAKLNISASTSRSNLAKAREQLRSIIRKTNEKVITGYE